MPLILRYLTAVLLLALGLVALPTIAAARPGLPDETSWPVPGSPRVVHGFDPPARRWGRGHRGVDMAAAVGDAIRAAAGGRVSFAGRIAGRGVVVVDHGSVRTTYEPVHATVAVGSRVRAGEAIGLLESGGSHCPAGSCLHWGLIEGKETYLDPMLLAPGSGAVRLVPAGQRQVAERLAAARAAAARRAAAEARREPARFVGAIGKGGFGHPVPGPITSPFGMRFHPVLKVWKLHDGTDFGAACGTPIVAPAGGRVVNRYFNRGYGNRLLVDHGSVSGRHVITGYNHATRYVVQAGQTVRKGQVIGYVGTTGFSTGCHLHLMVWLDGRLSNPMTWFEP